MSDAKITIDADSSAAARAAAVLKSAWQETGAAITSAIGTAASQMIGDLAGVVTAHGKINFSAQSDSVRAFESTSAHMAVSMGQDLEKVRVGLESVGTATGRRPQEVNAWAAEVGKLTYNFQGAIDAQQGLAGLAAETGRSVSDYKAFAAVLANVGKVGGDTTGVIGALASQASALGVSGGVAAFTDQITALGSTISQFSISSVEDFKKVTQFAATMGHGLTPQQAGRVSHGALSALTGNVRGYERYLGHHIADEHGHISDPNKIYAEIYEKAKRRSGSKEQLRNEMINTFGAETGSEIVYKGEHGGFHKDMTLAPSLAPQKALNAYLGSDGGKRDAAAVELDKSSRTLLGSSTMLGSAADKLQAFAAHNPLSSTLVTGALTAGAATFVTSFGGKIAKMMGQSGGGGAVGGAVSLVTKGAGGLGGMNMAGLGIAGAALGLGLYGISKFDDAQDQRHAAQRSAEDSEVANKNAAHGHMMNAKRRATELQKSGVDRGHAIYAANLEEEAKSHNGVAGGISGDALAKKIEQAIKDGMKGAKFEVKTRADTPVEVTTSGSHQAKAGDQSGGAP
ncbi:MAG: hypothetical protein ABI445_21915 [Polyangia bacterium]